MRRLLSAILVVMCASCATPAGGQKPRFVVFEPVVRNRLAEEWHEENRFQRERGYCLVARVQPGPVYDTWRVHYIERAREIMATTRSILPVCPDSTTTILHVHPPGFCVDALGNECYHGGDNGYQCQPSPNDIQFLLRSRRVMDAVQCGKNQIVPFFRDGGGFF